MAHELNTVCVVGLGYIGLPTAVMLASAGFSVKGTDVDDPVVEALNEGRAHFAEPDLDMLVRGAVSSGRLKAFGEPQPADAFIITVPTPIREDKAPDMSFVEAAARSVAPVLEPGNLVILESTSPLGTTENMANIIRDARPDLDEEGELKLAIAYCPERILPGQMVRELVQNDRIVGGLKPADAKRARDLYQRFVCGEIHMTDAKTAEMVKLIENAYRDVNIAFANEVAHISEAHALDVWEAIALANRHPRVNILNPGPGVGGHCIAVDPWFLISENPYLTRLMAQARIINDGRPERVIARVKEAAQRADTGKIACLGLAFKPDVGDLRESPAVEVIIGLAQRGFEICAVEPHVNALPEKLWPYDNVRLAGFEEALAKSDIIVLLVGHTRFAKRKGDVEGKVIIDAVGLWRDSGHG